MDTRYNKEKNEDEGTALDSKPSTPDPPNTGQGIDSNGKTGTTEKLLEDYYEANIDHNNTNLHIIWEIIKEEHRSLRDSLDVFNKTKLPYSSNNYLFIEKASKSQNDTDK